MSADEACRFGWWHWTLDNKMIDRPVVLAANATISRAQRCGVDFMALIQKWEAAKLLKHGPSENTQFN